MDNTVLCVVGTHRLRQNENGRGACTALRRRGGVRGLHAALPGHDHRHRRPHAGGDGGRAPPHGGRGGPGGELVGGAVRGGGRQMRAGHSAAGKAAGAGGGHGAVSGRAGAGAGLCRRQSRRRHPAAAAAAGVERQGAAALLAEVTDHRPGGAARLHLRDEKRILRALEVYYETGETITEHDRKSRETPPRYRALRIGLAFRDRADMWARIDRRVDDMVGRGCCRRWRHCCKAACPGTPRPCRLSATSSFWRWPRAAPPRPRPSGR